ncbi:MG2 domain-containing protein [Devosia algicola]|uniref:MG2 domain-containing protein n=1 Tax=Devosia algicola TaxID=3026418 RepID=A0ABY7YPA7_9HYPH|nr:MG2 domain-containing protein [Devosia algicola]WDR03138.1 MG2 domain-containing protein [Devosia algicola]
MLQWVRSISWVYFLVVLGFGLSNVHAAEPQISLQENTDLPGFDYAIIKNTDQNSCSAACASDNICDAFTYNQRSKWCFLKAGAGQATQFDGAISGTIARDPSAQAVDALRRAELPFPAANLIDAAKRLARELPQTDAPPPKTSYADLVVSGNQSFGAGNPAGAIIAYRQALAINANGFALWQALADATLARAAAVSGKSSGDNSYDLGLTATSAALNAFLRSQTHKDRANALASLAAAMEYRQNWREVIATYRLSLSLAQSQKIAAHLEDVVALHGFRVVDHVVDAESAAPRICAVFSEPLALGADLSAFVVVADTPQVAVETEQSQVCVDGVSHGSRYEIRLRAGLPSADGETLAKDVDLDVYVPDRTPFVGFANNAYVMPAGLGGGLPITSVNAQTAEIMIYRIGDRAIATAVRDGIFQGNLTQYSAEDIADRVGQQVWNGEIDLAQGAANVMTTTAIPVARTLGDMTAGAYVITARVKGTDTEYWTEMATQWFIVTDLGLTTFAGDDGVTAFVRGLGDAAPVAGATVRLVAVNNDILGQAKTDADGRASFAPGLSRGQGGRAPQLLTAETADGDYAFLDLSKPAFDLTDRGVEGRPAPGPLDLFATTERGVYRPGETVFLTALLRDAQANAVPDLPLTLSVERPDGVVAQKQVLKDQGAGGYFAALPMVEEAMRGSWTIRLYADPKADALATTAFLVEDFEPERLAFELNAPDAPLKAGAVSTVNLNAKYLYGATAPDLDVEADVIISPRTTLKDYPGYTFGRLDDTIETSREPLGVVATTDASGDAVAELTIPELQATTRPLAAQLLFRLVDTNGRTIERSLSRPLLADGNRLGIKPVFADPTGLAEGSEAQFQVVVVAPDGAAIAATGLKWTLSRVDTNYQWYRDGSTWKWEAISTTNKVASGSADTPDGGPVTIGANVDWGRYQIEVETTGEGATSSSLRILCGLLLCRRRQRYARYPSGCSGQARLSRR